MRSSECPMVFIDPAISDESELQSRSWKDRLRSLEKSGQLPTQTLESLSSGFDERISRPRYRNPTVGS